MNRTTRNLTNHLGEKPNRRSLATLLGVVVIAAATLGVTTAPASAKPNACKSARAQLAQHQRWLDWAHAYSDQSAINFYRSLVFDDQLSVLDAC
jgi:hypothetical protein